jgi:hypothetical protein
MKSIHLTKGTRGILKSILFCGLVMAVLVTNIPLCAGAEEETVIVTPTDWLGTDSESEICWGVTVGSATPSLTLTPDPADPENEVMCFQVTSNDDKSPFRGIITDPSKITIPTNAKSIISLRLRGVLAGVDRLKTLVSLGNAAHTMDNTESIDAYKGFNLFRAQGEGIFYQNSANAQTLINASAGDVWYRYTVVLDQTRLPLRSYDLYVVNESTGASYSYKNIRIKDYTQTVDCLIILNQVAMAESGKTTKALIDDVSIKTVSETPKSYIINDTFTDEQVNGEILSNTGTNTISVDNSPTGDGKALKMKAVGPSETVETIWTDSFEYEDQAALETVWSQEPGRQKAVLITGQHRTGEKALRSGYAGSMMLGKNIPEGVNRVSAWFYDDMTANTLTGVMMLWVPGYSGETNQLIIGLNNNASGGTYYVRLAGNIATNSNPRRSVGWHKFTADVSQGSLRVFLDDALTPYCEISTVTSFTRLSLGTLWANTANTTAAWDDVAFEKVTTSAYMPPDFKISQRAVTPIEDGVRAYEARLYTGYAETGAAYPFQIQSDTSASPVYIGYKNGNIVAKTGETGDNEKTLCPYLVNQWVNFKAVVNMNAKTADVYINGVKYIDNEDIYDKNITSVGTLINQCTQDMLLYIDDVKIYAPEPVIMETVGSNGNETQELNTVVPGMVGKASYFVDRTAPGAPETPTLVLAYYWGNRLIGVAYSTQTVENGQNGYITAQNLIPVGASAVKAFIWNSFGELIPVAAPSVRSVPAGPDGPPKNVQGLISPSDSNIKYFGRWVDIGGKKLVTGAARISRQILRERP